jgi:protoheme IX farnesyltransferase
LLASGDHIDFGRFITTLLGVSLVIGCGCVYNNYLDREIDKKMERTKRRALVQGKIGLRTALIYGTVLGLVGFGLLVFFTNRLTVIIGLVGLVDYVVLYGYTKRRGSYGTLVGSVSGATPPLAGYTAVTGHLDAAGILLFLILTFWQMPHFYAIAMYRLKDYQRASIPVLPVLKGPQLTKIYIVGYIAWFIIACLMLSLFGYTGVVFAAVMTILGVWWLWAGVQGFRSGVDDTKWARGMFGKSLIVLLAFCLLVSASALLP